MRMNVWSLIEVGKYDKALELLIRGKTAHKNSNYTSSRYSLRGCVHEKMGNYSSALEYYRKSVSIQLQIHGDSPHPDIAASYNNIGNVYQSQGNYNSAVENRQKSMSMQLQVHGDSPHPDIAASYNNIGNVYLSQENYSSALEYHQKSLSIRLKI